VQALLPDSYQFLSIFEGDRFLAWLLLVNTGLMLNRIGQRMFFVTAYYGLFQGLLSVPRIIWGNLVNFLANVRAIRQIIEHGSPRRVAWDKTTHDFPSLGDEARARLPLGHILVAQGVLTEEQLQHALVNRSRALRLGSWLVHKDYISAEQLAAALAAQSHLDWEPLDAWSLPADLVMQRPPELALHYAVLPLREEGNTLVVGCESALDPVSLAALARKLGRRVRCVIVPKGAVTVGLRHWHARRRSEDPRRLLEEAVATGQVPAEQAPALWQRYVSRQVLLAEVLTSLGHLNNATLKSLLLRQERQPGSIGDFLVEQGVISRDTLEQAAQVQRSLQPGIALLIAAAATGAPASQLLEKQA
jgi:adsorption protein B